MHNLKVIVVDDTIVYRKIVSDVLNSIPGIQVVAAAHNGKIALSKIKTLKPDLITLDIEMPEVNGIEVLEALREHPDPPMVIMVSTLTQRGGEMTMKALDLGAFDFIGKPDQGTMAENTIKIKEAMLPIINILKKQKRSTGGTVSRPVPVKPKPVREKPAGDTNFFFKKSPAVSRKSTAEIVGIGISTGGPNALGKMIPMLPANLKVPVLIVQHMPPIFTESLAKSLDGKSQNSVKEAADNDVLTPGTIYIAPGGKQMKIVAGVDGVTRKIKITDDPPENSCKPSVDYLFRSIAQHYVGRSTGVIMTGMGSDGSKGLAQMKKNGSTVIAQDEQSCTVFGMPKEPIESGIADVVAPLEKIAKEIVNTIG